MDPILISITEIKQYVDIDSKYSEDRINTYIRQVQHNRLRNLIGEGMYYDFINKVSSDTLTTAYNNFFTGKTYVYNGKTIQYYGIKPYLALFVVAEISVLGNVFLTNKGMMEFNDEQTIKVPSQSKITAVSQEFASRGGIYENDIIQFLQQNKSNYPLWEDKNKKLITRFKFSIMN